MKPCAVRTLPYSRARKGPAQMSLYYDHAGIQIHLGDCRLVLPTLPKRRPGTRRKP